MIPLIHSFIPEKSSHELHYLFDAFPLKKKTKQNALILGLKVGNLCSQNGLKLIYLHNSRFKDIQGKVHTEKGVYRVKTVRS